MRRIRTLKASQFLPQDLPEMFGLGILPLLQKRLIHKIIWLNSRRIRSRRCISINSRRLRHSSVGRRSSKHKCVKGVVTFRKQCVGSKRLRWSTRWTISRRRNQFEDIDSQDLRCWMRRSLLLGRKSSKIRTSRSTRFRSTWRRR